MFWNEIKYSYRSSDVQDTLYDLEIFMSADFILNVRS